MSLEKSAGETVGELLAVEKTIEQPEQPTTIVAFTVTAIADTPVAFRIVDELPESLSPSATGFHVDHRFDNWTLYEDRRVTLADTIAPGETLVAFYYLDDASIPREQIDAPTIEHTTRIKPEVLETADPPQWRSPDAATVSKDSVTDGPLPAPLAPASGESAVQPADADADGEPSSSSSRSGTGEGTALRSPEPAIDEAFAELEAEHGQCEYAEFGDDVEQYYPDDVSFEELLALGDPDRGRSATEGPGDETSATTGPPEGSRCRADGTADADRELSDESVLAALLREVDRLDPSAEAVVALREALGVEAARHTTVQIRHLQAEVADLTAYVDALEAFLDENGSATELLASIEDDLDGVTNRLTRLDARVDGLYERQSDLGERVDDLERDVEVAADARAEVEQLREESSQLAARLDDTDERLTRVMAELETLSDTVATHRDQLTALEDTAAELQGHHEVLREAFTGAASELSTTSATDG